MKRSIFAALFFVLTSATAWALESPFSNLEQLVSQTRISSLLRPETTRHHVRIAILDNGFRNFELEVGKSLPTSTSFHVGPVAVPETQLENHGTAMAQIVAGLLDRGSNGNFTYDLLLYSAFGYSNLSAAVNDAIAKKADVILYSQVWEYGGFGNGSGFINEVANRLHLVEYSGSMPQETSLRAPINRELSQQMTAGLNFPHQMTASEFVAKKNVRCEWS